MKWLSDTREDTSGQCWRVCPACESPLRWIEFLIAKRSWANIVKRRIVEEPRCDLHGRVDWWLIRDRDHGIVGRASLNDGRRVRVYDSQGNLVMKPATRKAKSLDTGEVEVVPVLNPDGSQAMRPAYRERSSKLYPRPAKWRPYTNRAVLLGDPSPWAGRWRRNKPAETNVDTDVRQMVLPLGGERER